VIHHELTKSVPIDQHDLLAFDFADVVESIGTKPACGEDYTLLAAMHIHIAVMLFGFALLLVLAAFGFVGAHPTAGNPLDTPEASGRIIGGLLPAVVLSAGGVWLWQKYKT
jgi:hypothetical protein